MTPDGPETRLKRLRMRSWRRGMREMDLVLGPWADEWLGRMDPAGQDLFEALLAENDAEILTWITGQTPPPEPYAALIEALRGHARARHEAARADAGNA